MRRAFWARPAVANVRLGSVTDQVSRHSHNSAAHNEKDSSGAADPLDDAVFQHAGEPAALVPCVSSGMTEGTLNSGRTRCARAPPGYG